MKLQAINIYVFKLRRIHFRIKFTAIYFIGKQPTMNVECSFRFLALNYPYTLICHYTQTSNISSAIDIKLKPIYSYIHSDKIMLTAFTTFILAEMKE